MTKATCEGSFEAVKYSYRQSKDGFVLAFVVHPSDMPDVLATAPIGMRFMLAFAAIQDREPQSTPTARVVEGGVTGLPSTDGPAAPMRKADEPSPPMPKPKRNWDGVSLAEQAGILCKTDEFRAYVRELTRSIYPCTPEEVEAFVRMHCGVTSRAHIKRGELSGNLWQALEGNFRAWQQHKSHTRAA